MFLPLFSQVAMVEKQSGAPGVGRPEIDHDGRPRAGQGMPQSGTIQPGPPTFSP